jgi:hypothetical protein
VNLLDRIAERRPVVDHDGRSGALIERGVLDDGAHVYIKTSSVDTDIGQLLTGDARRELRLWRDGILDTLPPPVGCAVIGIEDLGDRLVTITRDLGNTVLHWGVQLGSDHVRRILRGITEVHANFAGSAPDRLCRLATRLSAFAPSRLDSIRRANPGVAAAVARGHELLHDLLPAEVADAVHRSFDNPDLLAAALTADAPITLLHGDFCLVNIALEGDEMTPLDWGLATAGPAVVDLITFCVGAMSNVAFDRERLLAEANIACRPHTDDETFQLGEFWALMELGWNKALDAVDHPDPRKRAAEHGDLDFWIARARRALDAGLVPEGAPRMATPDRGWVEAGGPGSGL